MSKDKELKDLFLDTLKDIYFAEKKILSALPKMAKAAQDGKLKAAFEKHHAVPASREKDRQERSGEPGADERDLRSVAGFQSHKAARRISTKRLTSSYRL